MTTGKILKTVHPKLRGWEEGEGKLISRIAYSNQKLANATGMLKVLLPNRQIGRWASIQKC
jgi:hypothetical protein